MNADDSSNLLHRYARHGDEAAFRELVRRHAGLVYATVQRRLGNQSDQTADVAQAVFVKLAQRARALPPDLVLPVWLHTMAVRLASNHLRSEARRAVREQTSVVMNDPVNTPPEWQTLAPELDEALLSLKNKDREALLLRYFEGRDVAGTGKAMGISADAAQKRIARALDRLRSLLVRRGITVSAGALAVCLGTPAARAVPAGFAGKAAAAGMVAKPEAWLLPWLTGIFRTAPWCAAAGAVAALTAAAFIPAPVEKRKEVVASETDDKRAQAVKVAAGSSQAEALAEVRALLGRELTAEEIVAEFEHLSKAPRTPANRLRFRVVLEQVAEANAARVAALCDETLSLPGQVFAMKEVLSRWCGFDPSPALDFMIGRRLEERIDGSNPGMVSDLVAQWAQQDLDAAAAWVIKNISSRPFQWNRLTFEAEMLCAQSPKKGAAFLARLPEGEVKHELLTDLGQEGGPGNLFEDWTSAEWGLWAGAVANAGAGLPPPFLSAVLASWSARQPDAARAWVEALPPGPQKVAAACGLAGDADQAARVLSTTEEASRGPALRGIAGQWFDDEAREWVMINSEGAERDDALRVMAGKKQLQDRETAMRHAAAISDETLRNDVTAALYLRWSLDDEQSAQEWLAKAGLPATLQSRLEELVP